MTIKTLNNSETFISTVDTVSKTIDVDIEIKELEEEGIQSCLMGYVETNEDNSDSLSLDISTWKFIGSDTINGILEFRVTYEIA